MMHSGFNRQSSLKDKLKYSICCFTGTVHHHHDHSLEHYNKLDTPRTPLSPSSWFRKSPTSSEYAVDPPRVRGRSLRSRMGHRKHHHHHHHRQSQSADFSYDPSSYALNFENESPEKEFPFRNFSSGLPASPHTPSSPPPLSHSDELPKEIIGYS